LLLALFTSGICTAELTRSEKLELLDKAEAALIWFHTIGDEVAMSRIPAQEYRERISPTELIQAAALLYSYRDAEKTALAEKLLPFIPYYRLTPEECFEINDLLGQTDIPDLAEIQTTDLGRIAVEANRFRTESLNSAERVVLYEEPATALELMKVVDILSGVGRPVFVRHYLRKFLRGEHFEATPEESAKIVETLGTQKLMQLAVHPEFTPLAKEVVAKIIDEAKKHWQAPDRIAEALKETQWFTDETKSDETKAGMERSAMTDTPRIRPEARAALHVIWKGDKISVQQVFEKLGTIKDERDADELTAVLLSLRPDMKEALAATLQSDEPKLRFHAARGLAASVSQQDSFLLYPFLFARRVVEEISEAEREIVRNILGQRRITIPSQEQAATILHERAKDYFEHRRPIRIDADGNIAFWAWCYYLPETGKGAIIYETGNDIEAAYQYLALKYYGQSFGIVPTTSANHEMYRLLYAIATLEYGLRHVVNAPISHNGYAAQTTKMHVDVATMADELGFERGTFKSVEEQILQMSLEKNCFFAAESVLRDWRWAVESDEVLKPTNGRPRTLVQATVAKNRNVRFAALEAIMNLTATQSPALEPFAGSSLVADTLVWFSKSERESVILAGHPQTASAILTANLFLGLGYKPDVATTCRELFERAAASPDVEAVFVDVRTAQPPVGQFVQMMRQDARTAEIPIAILSGTERSLGASLGGLRPSLLRRSEMTRFDRRSSDNPFRTSLSLTYPRLANEDAARWVLNDLFDKSGGCKPAGASADVRLEQAKQALVWLREIKEAELESGVKIYHFEDFDSVVLHALHSERRVAEGLALATVVKSAVLQSALYETVANAVYPMELRQQAGSAFEESITRFGILLRGSQVQRLYDRYNMSELEPTESQELLSRLIDVVEEKVGVRSEE